MSAKRLISSLSASHAKLLLGEKRTLQVFPPSQKANTVRFLPLGELNSTSSCTFWTGLSYFPELINWASNRVHCATGFGLDPANA
jgi:hypothetical protein